MNVKQGQLAIVISASVTPELIGTIVRVLRPENGQLEWRAVDGHEFICRAGQGPSWVVEIEGGLIPWRSMNPNTPLKWFTERPFLDKHLRPVEGIPDTDEVENERTTKMLR